ncbi:hypothetical protein [Halomarina pelagica]|uniref:hypothetical protein n=1 Tax=Halomarina pelagica TaxID=2961599 RepID=UPI0020C24068|nr:hypothetical protein [Halomarina sp. BND7]
MNEQEGDLYEPSLIKRLIKLGPQRLVLSWDTLAGVVAFFAVFIVMDGSVAESEAIGILSSFATVSATLFAIVLTGLTIITSFTDRLFLYAWQDIGEFENVLTIFQYNLVLPIAVLLFTLTLQVVYHPFAMICLIALFVYMLFALFDLVGLISSYALQRGEFVKQFVEKSLEQDEGRKRNPVERLSDEELLRVRQQLNELEKQKKRDQ